MPSPKSVALVIGTLSSVGMHAAFRPAQVGHTVVATMRSVGKADMLRSTEASAGVEVGLRALDVTNDQQARSVVESVLADHGRVDVLVNNAGQGLVGTIEELRLDDLRSQVEVNYISVARMTRLVLRAMRARRSGRIVTVNTVGGVMGQPYNGSYCATKFATEGFMESPAPIAAQLNVQVSVVEPGAAPRISCQSQ